MYFKQYSFTKKAWKSSDGSMALIPKDEGAGVMISAFVSREFGYGFELNNEDLVKVNTYRRGKQYSDRDAARKKMGNANKKPLTTSPFVIKFEYGVQGEGYWNYDAMSVQFEDCIDCMKVLHPQYDIIFLFDHSCGHDRKRPDGLNAGAMSKGYGGSQVKMRNSTIFREQGYLGEYYKQVNLLKVGDSQTMIYAADDVGPSYLSPEQRQLKRMDRDTGKCKKVKHTRSELIKMLAEKDIIAQGNLKKIQEIARNSDVPIDHDKPIIEEGWVGKPKGMMQLLYERGFLDSTKLDSYTLNGKKDEYGNTIPNTSLKEMMNSLVDISEEETLLQYHGRLLGVTVDRSPKCHPEIAGEGIEYCWAAAKMCYRQLRISEKRTKAKFLNSVKISTDRNKVLTLAMQRKFSRRARQYMLAYRAIDIQSENNENEEVKMSHSLLENVLKAFKTHRCTADTDSKWINTVVGTMRNPILILD